MGFWWPGHRILRGRLRGRGLPFPLTPSAARTKAGRSAVSPAEQTKQFKVISLCSHTHHQPLTEQLWPRPGAGQDAAGEITREPRGKGPRGAGAGAGEPAAGRGGRRKDGPGSPGPGAHESPPRESAPRSPAVQGLLPAPSAPSPPSAVQGPARPLPGSAAPPSGRRAPRLVFYTAKSPLRGRRPRDLSPTLGASEAPLRGLGRLLPCLSAHHPGLDRPFLPPGTALGWWPPTHETTAPVSLAVSQTPLHGAQPCGHASSVP